MTLLSKRPHSLIWLVHVLMIAASIVWIGGNTWFAGFQSEITMSLDIVFIVISGAAAITILALAAIVIAVCGGYYMVRRSHQHPEHSGTEQTTHN